MIRKTDPSAIAPYLRDASNYSGGRASEVVIPEDCEELIAFLQANDQPLTVAGAGTGLTASRVPLSGVVVSLEKFRHLEGPVEGQVRCGPAVRLKELQEHLKGKGWFYPPNPTESLASLGGTLATNASGSRSYKWGATRDFVLEAEVVLADGRVARVRRGQTISDPLVFDDGSKIDFPPIRYTSPPIKNAAGFYVRPGMDWLDLFIGSDGTLCLFTGMTLKLLPEPADFLSGILFLESEETCWDLVETIRCSDDPWIRPCALEYFDRYSLERLRTCFSGIPEGGQAALFFEQDVARKEDFEPCLEAWYGFLEPLPLMLEDSWFADSPRDLEKFHDFRHQVPLIVNEENSREGRVKIGTDMAVGHEHFKEMMRFYKTTLEAGGVPYVMFGHIGDNHLHINLLPDSEQKERAQEIYDALVEKILNWGGTVSAEHGIGKLKRKYYHRMVGPRALEDLRTLKRLFDPGGLLGQGNLL